MPELKLESGKRYRNANGAEKSITKANRKPGYPFEDQFGDCYSADGSSNRGGLFDLIEEVVVEPESLESKAVAEVSGAIAAVHAHYCEKPESPTAPKTETVSPGIDQIPFEGIEAIGEIFAEGEPKYGRDNWKKDTGNVDYDRERCRHAMRHLWLYANGDRSENHISKVAWYCVTQIWRENQRNVT